MSTVKKIVVLGSVSSGKSALLRRIRGLPFQKEEAPTLGLRVSSVMPDHAHIEKLVFWELTNAGKLEHQPVDYLKGAHACIYVFDLSRPSTYLNLNAEINFLKEVLPGVDILLVGNKRDLVSKKQCQQLEKELQSEALHFVSAKRDEQFQPVLDHLIKRML